MSYFTSSVGTSNSSSQLFSASNYALYLIPCFFFLEWAIERQNTYFRECFQVDIDDMVPIEFEGRCVSAIMRTKIFPHQSEPRAVYP